MSAAPIKVLLVDNHPLVLDGLKAILETFPNIVVVGTAGLASQGLALARTAQPDVVLLDINMPQISGIDAIEMFREEVPGIRLLMLSMHDSREYISTSVLHGASGYVLKDVSTEEIVAAIEAVAAGGTYFSSGVSDVLLARQAQGPDNPLTAREYGVLLLVASGKSNKEIGDLLTITEKTVKTHVSHVLDKLGLADRTQAAIFAVKHGLD